MLELMIGAVVGGVVETLTGLAVNQTPSVARRIQQTAGLVEKQPPTAMSAAIRRAVDSAAAELRQDYVDQLYEGDADASVTDLIALLDHPPFAEEVTRKLLYRGQPDFERLRRAYLDLPPAQRSQRWDALEPALLVFFDAIEDHLRSDLEVGELVQGLQQLARLTRIADKTDLIAEISVQIQDYQARIAEAGESAAGGIEQLVRLMDRQHATLLTIAELLRQTQLPSFATLVQGNVNVTGGDFVGRDKIATPRSTLPAVRAYLNSLRQECNRLPLAGDIRNAANRSRRPELVNVYVDLQVDVLPTLEQIFDRLHLSSVDREMLLTRIKASIMMQGLPAFPAHIFDSPFKGSAEVLQYLHSGLEGELAEHLLMPYAESESELLRSLDKLTALEALSAHRHLVLLGDPGSGKSTFVNHLAVVFADQILNGVMQSDLIPGLNAPLLPLRVVLRRWSARLRPGDEGGRELAYAALMQQTSLDRETLLAQLDQPDNLVLFDGLDESPARRPGNEDGLDRRGLLVASVADFCAAHPRCRVLVTCRIKPYQSAGYQIDNLPVVTLAELDKPRIERFVHLWYDEAARLEPEKADKAADDRRRLLTSLDRRPDLTLMAGTPLLLTMLATVNAWAGLPESRAELYDRCVEQLLWEWERRKRDATRPEDAPAAADSAADSATEATSLLDLLHEAGLRRVDVERLLWEQTYLAHEQSSANGDSNREARADLPVDSVRKALALMHGKGGQGWDWAERVVDLMAERGGLLVESETGTFTFPHRTFQEYLAARWLLERDDRATLAARLAASDTWREVVLLACGYLNYQGRYGDVQALIAEISGGRFADETAWRRLLVAGTAWLEFGPDRAVGNTGEDIKRQLPEKLIALMQDANAPIPQRAAAGVTLGQLGDPRRGVGLRRDGLPDIDWVPIAAGPFLMGSDKRVDPDAYDDETPQFTCRLITQPYRMARYPITVAQYACFIAAGGYHERRFWTDAGWSWRIENKIEGPAEYSDPFQTPNHPQVGVSWYEAVAYCNWLSEALNTDIRLPSEAEWERAARHTDGRIYPWGGEFSPEKCNMDETGIDATSAVGLFLNGAAESGALDMVGNVWEWCSTQWRDYYQNYESAADDSLAGAHRRVLRGGSFYFVRQALRCAYRHWGYPDFRHYNFGFRVLSPGL